ncbi:hypothetical protein DASC09_050460 [Saccharomycopsis crataegensis]|uniref:Uncharacterized protein n=1 Tax=Saccharomycopsis crataegensis TaxID=43959 RepID=A0AAV5QSL6_9ASCO|nr:hypothetical protein DASC09_050460 [Saccharomycopsis crataegensis]
MFASSAIQLSALVATANAFLYTYATGDLTVTVSSVTYVSTVIDGNTYDLSFLAPTVTNTVHSAATDSMNEVFDISASGIQYNDETQTGNLPTDTATTFVTYGSNSTDSTTSSTASQVTSTITTYPADNSTTSLTSTSESLNTTSTNATASGMAPSLSSGFALGGGLVMAAICLL